MVTETRLESAPVIDDILAIRERWHTKHHPFFGALAEGKLPLRALGVYMAMHWHFVQRALASFGILFARTFAYEDVRKMVVENRAEAEA
jgi:pyrroloquinoline quinone (PQQ) biosynthesis protein C